MKQPARILLVLAGSVLAGACAATDIGSEYMEVSEEASELLFYGPGLAGGFRRFVTGQDKHYVRRTVATYGPKLGEYPFAQMYLAETPPTRHFTLVPAVEKTIEDWEWFENKPVEIGASGAAVNAIGRIDFVTATADGIACVVWLQVFGLRDDGGVGTRLLSGFYCKGDGAMIPAAEAGSIVKLVGHRKYGAVAPPKGWSAAATPAVLIAAE